MAEASVNAFPITFRDIHFTAGGREILRGLTGAAIPGRTLTILGSSGAGKTTFLNRLADQLDTGEGKILGGSVLIGNTVMDRKYRSLLGYVTQDDIIGPYDTPESALRFSIRLRCGYDIETSEARVEQLLEDLHLTHARSTIVGIPGVVAGLSGGERKRVNIGIELIADTKILLLDEPTSGLDSVTSELIVAKLRDIARKGYTVIYTIHQPTSRAFTDFDDLLLMTAGRIVYHGPAHQATRYFSRVGYPCPQYYTPTDYFMQLLQNPETSEKLIEVWDAEKIIYGNPLTTDDPWVGGVNSLDELVTHRGSSLSIQAYELLRRAFSGVLRDRLAIGMALVQSLFFSIVAGLLFINLKHTVTGVQDTLGALFMVVLNRSFGSVMGVVNTFAPKKAVFLREQRAGAYPPIIYLFSLWVSQLPVFLLMEIVSSLIVYFMLDLARDALAYFTYLFALFMLGQVGTAFGMLIATAVSRIEVASSLAPAVVVPLMLAGGLFATTSRLRPYWYWLEKLSFLRYGFVILVHNEFTRVPSISCDPVKFGSFFCNATYKTGIDVIASLELNDAQDEPYVMWISIAAMFVLSWSLSVVALSCAARTKM